jgi:hypothetical protein
MTLTAARNSEVLVIAYSISLDTYLYSGSIGWVHCAFDAYLLVASPRRAIVHMLHYLKVRITCRMVACALASQEVIWAHYRTIHQHQCATL